MTFSEKVPKVNTVRVEYLDFDLVLIEKGNILSDGGGFARGGAKDDYSSLRGLLHYTDLVAGQDWVFLEASKTVSQHLFEHLLIFFLKPRIEGLVESLKN